MHKQHSIPLVNGDRVCVVGGGPAGAMTAYFILELAKRVNLQITVDIFERKDFGVFGPKGCNHCGGIVSESLLQMLAMEGIVLPSAVVQCGIEAYVVHSGAYSTRINTPNQEKRIASIYRGSGPKGAEHVTWSSFDGFLLSMAEANGAVIHRVKVDKLGWRGDKPLVFANEETFGPYDFLVGAVGVNAGSQDLFRDVLGPHCPPPETVRTFICELFMGHDALARILGESMHVFLQDLPGVEFAAIIPKKEYATVCLLGSVSPQQVKAFLASDEVQRLFASNPAILDKVCNCVPAINMTGMKKPYAHRVAMVGDCGVTRLFKDGLGAAYRNSKGLASAVVFEGVSEDDLAEHFAPSIRRMRRDNAVGKLLFLAVGVVRKCSALRNAAMSMAEAEQKSGAGFMPMSSIMWDMFTGSASYIDICKRSVHPRFLLGFVKWFFISLCARAKR
ncbi:MAG: hypothetical protein KKA55_13550 [Proteobacteria bacterium]|nr:hypothetical protein [Pseudomonadota bacterium]MBU1596544.1 hypothetical protein [Pseudomonadota bacterium]